MSKDKHIFAIYYSGISGLPDLHSNQEFFTFKNCEIYDRIIKVLRLQARDEVIFFDENINVLLKIDNLVKNKEITGGIVNIRKNVVFSPQIILYQCLTNKSDFEDIIYMASQMGVSKIIPVLSQKSCCKWYCDKSQERLLKIAVSAAEQSKSFIIPKLCKPQKLKDIVERFDSKNAETRIYFDFGGQPIAENVHDLWSNKESIIVLFGPEGGLSNMENEFLVSHGFIDYSLFKTVLRSKEAVAVGLGFIRCFSSLK
jgi:16S rRNA (uracil1498-N3)-methyltransferase